LYLQILVLSRWEQFAYEIQGKVLWIKSLRCRKPAFLLKRRLAVVMPWPLHPHPFRNKLMEIALGRNWKYCQLFSKH
jgi:hypothetical protein